MGQHRYAESNDKGHEFRDLHGQGHETKIHSDKQGPFQLIERLPRRADHVFVDRKVMPLKGGYVTKRFKQYIRRAGLSEQFHWHHLRATFASYLVQSSTPLAEVQRLLGHSSVVTTQIYAVVSDDNLRNAADKIHLDEFTPKGLLQ
jgi:site-specific recombinase XerD